jgi:plasmid stabilization system protein ParE
MPYRVIFSPRAEAQLVKLHRDIGERSSPKIGERYTAAIVKYCLAFSTFPHRGTLNDDIRPGIRIIGYRKRATIAFEVTGDTVNVLGVYYGGQDYEADLRDDQE